LVKGYGQAGQTVTGAVQQVNPEILATAAQQGQNVTGAAATAGQGAVSAADKLSSLLNPYMQGGQFGMEQLMSGMAPGGALSQPFTASMMAQYSPAYQFQLQQGKQAAAQQAVASGMGDSGGFSKALSRYNQDYANTAFGSAANLYNTQQQNQFNRLAALASGGQAAATTAGQAGIGAAEYAGTTGLQGAQWAGGANIGARNLAAGNTLSGANFLANTQINAAKGLAQGDLGAASSWNNMLSGIGAAGNELLLGGLGGAAGTTPGWSWGNIGKNIWGQG